MTEAEQQEKTLDHLEQQIPALSAAAVEVAYWRTLAAGLSVMVSENDAIYEVFPDGTRQFVKHTAKAFTLPLGTRLKIS